METDLNMTVEERMATEEAEATEEARPHLPDNSVGYLWLSNFISSFLVARSFEGFLHSVDAWRNCMANELHFECRTLDYARCQVVLVDISSSCRESCCIAKSCIMCWLGLLCSFNVVTFKTLFVI